MEEMPAKEFDDAEDDNGEPWEIANRNGRGSRNGKGGTEDGVRTPDSGVPGANASTQQKKRSHLELNVGDHQDDVTMEPTAPDKSQATIKELIVERGQKMTDTNTTMTTKIKIEFNIQDTTKPFPLRHALIGLIAKMKTKDATLSVKSVVDESQWSDPSLYPSGPEFTSHFNVREETTSSNGREGTGTTKVLVHMSMMSKKRLQEIKFEDDIIGYLKANHIYMKVARYEMRALSSPGFLIHLHPRLTHLPSLQLTMRHGMEHVKTTDIEDVQEWRSKFPDRVAGKPEKAGDLDMSHFTNTVPEFTIFSGKRSFGGGANKVSTVCLNIQCASEDAKYLKALLARASEEKRIEGLFVPAGIHLIESPAVYIGLLRSQNQYLNSTTCVPIFGMHPAALCDIIGEEGAQCTLGEHLDKHATFIESAQRTNKTESEGKWFLMCKKENVEKVNAMIDGPLKDIFDKFVPKEDKYEDYPYPRRNIPQTASAPKTSSTIGTYAQVLRAFGNPQTGETASVNTNLDSAPARPRKRQAVQFVFDEIEFPATSPQQATESPPTVTQASTQETTMTTMTPPDTSSTMNWDHKLAEMNKNIQTQINAMQTKQDARIDQMQITQNENMKTLQATQDMKMQDLFDKFQTSMTDMFSNMQKAFGTQANTNKTPQGHSTGSPSTSSITNRVENSSVVDAQI
jgi:5-hydroxyisourate hydrolase-like protein (transthyretin family)